MSENPVKVVRINKQLGDCAFLLDNFWYNNALVGQKNTSRQSLF